MKFLFPFLALLMTGLFSVPGYAQNPIVEQVIIQQVNQNFRGSAVVLGQVTINAPQAGEVLVHFNGNCVSSSGDRIILAASNTTDWSVNDGHTAVEAYDSDVNRHSFSHTRKYNVGAGNTTFYAVGQNFVETDGDGIASVYGMLTITYYPELAGSTPQPRVFHTGVIEINRAIRGAAEEIASLSFNAPLAGKAKVRFDGMCVSDPGDLIVIAASDDIGWTVNDGNTGTEAIDDDLNTRVFSHTRVYNIGAGSHTFYGVAQNFVETAGDGMASFYASLTVEYYPDIAGGPTVYHQGVNQTNVNVEGAPVTMGQINFEALGAGKVVVTYDGLCASSPDDRVVMAASNTQDWSSNSGNVNVEAISADFNYNNFSHTRVYDVTEGSQSFYAICENFVETGGNGIASNYASLTVSYYPDFVMVGTNEMEKVSANISVSPNPVDDQLILQYAGTIQESFQLDVVDATGRTIKDYGVVATAEIQTKSLDLSDLTAGIYFIRLRNTERFGVQRIVKK